MYLHAHAPYSNPALTLPSPFSGVVPGDPEFNSTTLCRYRVSVEFLSFHCCVHSIYFCPQKHAIRCRFNLRGRHEMSVLRCSPGFLPGSTVVRYLHLFPLRSLNVTFLKSTTKSMTHNSTSASGRAMMLPRMPRIALWKYVLRTFESG